MAVLNPHFDLPFRFENGKVAIVEQDTYADIANCVEMLIRTPIGFRNDSPDYGLPQIEFDLLPLSADDLASFIVSQEPRAEVLIEQKPDLFDQLVSSLRVQILQAGGD